MRPQFEAGDTLQFTFVSSVAPDAEPLFAVIGSGNTLVASVTALSSSSTAFYALFTMPSSADGVYMGEWSAQKSVGGTAYPFRRRFLFNVLRTRF